MNDKTLLLALVAICAQAFHESELAFKAYCNVILELMQRADDEVEQLLKDGLEKLRTAVVEYIWDDAPDA